MSRKSSRFFSGRPGYSTVNSVSALVANWSLTFPAVDCPGCIAQNRRGNMLPVVTAGVLDWKCSNPDCDNTVRSVPVELVTEEV